MNCVLMQIVDLRHFFQTAAYMRYKAGQELDCKFSHSAIYSSEKIVCRHQKNGIVRTPKFEKKEAHSPPLSKESSLSGVRSRLSRTFSGEMGEKEEPKSISEAADSPKSPALKTHGTMSIFRRSKNLESKPPKSTEVKETLHIDVTRDENGMKFKEEPSKRKQFAIKVKGKIAALEYGIFI